MQKLPLVRFGSFKLDVNAMQLWRGRREVRLTSRVLKVLLCLVEHSDQLVTKEELFRTIWGKTVVSDAALAVCIGKLRQALADDPHSPRFIATVHGQGYRFISSVRSVLPDNWNKEIPTLSPHSTSFMVGRETELAHLYKQWERAQNGERQLVFVTGEAGVGKTTLVEAFMERMRAEGNSLFGWGQSIEQYGTSAAYLPILDALGRLCRRPAGRRLIRVLERHAPTWLIHMPGLLTSAKLQALQQRVSGSTKERRLQELTVALEVIASDRGLVLVLEDLQWSDTATLEWLAYQARRRERARFIIIGTYRPADAALRELPLNAVTHELQLHRQCTELALDFLNGKEVGFYLRMRFPGQQFPQELVSMIHRRTDGNPLFMVNVVDELTRQGILQQEGKQWHLTASLQHIEIGIPSNLRQLTESQLERLTAMEQRVLEAGSVAGMEFSAAAVATGTAQTIEEVEGYCERLAQRGQLLQLAGASEWPDGTVAPQYSFLHALYQEVVYKRVTAARRTRLHQQIGERKEIAYGARVSEIAAELAMHFERGRDWRKAVYYSQQAARNALQRNAHHEAASLLVNGLELIKRLPRSFESIQQELELRTVLGPTLMATKGFADKEVEKVYARALALSWQIKETPQLFPTLMGLWRFYSVRRETQTEWELANRLLRIAQDAQKPALLIEAYRGAGTTLYNRGELPSARTHLEAGLALYNPQLGRSHLLLYGQDPGVVCLSYLALVLWQLGYPEQAVRKSQEALALARQLSHPFSLAYALTWTALFHQLRWEVEATQHWAEATIPLCRERGFTHLLAMTLVTWGWALVEGERGTDGITHIQEGITIWETMGAEVARKHWYALLARAHGKFGYAEKGLAILSKRLLINSSR